MKRVWVFLFILTSLFLLPVMSAAVLFESEWNDSLGNSTTALRDGTRWSTVLGSSDALYIVSSEGFDFPMANILRSEQEDSVSAKGVIGEALWPLPDIGETIYFRIYWRNENPTAATGGDTHNHPIQPCRLAGSDCPSAWLVHTHVGLPGWDMGVSYESPGPTKRFKVPTNSLSYNTTYRIEWAQTRVDTNTWNGHMRLYASNGTLLYDDDDFSTGSETLAENVNVFFNNAEAIQDMLIGWEGGAGVVGGGEYHYYGGFAVCDTTWCGAYGAASNNPADFDSDNIVNKTDILKIIYWILGIDRTNSAVDLDNNGAVNIFDLVNASRLFGKQYGTDSTAPSIVSSRPTNNTNLSAGTTQTVLFAETNERATCRYLNTTGGSFATMNNFTRTGRVSHSIQLTGLTGGTTYNYYIQCQDEALNLNSTNYHVRFGIDSSDTPSYNVGTDYLIYSDIFDAYVSPDDRHTQLLSLRGSQGSNHDIFLSDNRPADSHAAVEAADPTFYTRYNITSPGIGGAGRALRSTYLGSTSPNQAIAWITWPVSQQKYYNGNHGNLVERNATHVINVKFKVISEGWDVEWPGWKFFELWYDTQSNRAQGSVVPAGSTGDLGGQTSGWWRPNIGGTEYGSYVNDFARWEDVNNDNSTWHDLLILYKASDTSGDGTGRFRG